MNRKDAIERAAELVSNAQQLADEAYELLKPHMSKDERLMHDGCDLADELRGAIVTLSGVNTNLIDMQEVVDQ